VRGCGQAEILPVGYENIVVEHGEARPAGKVPLRYGRDAAAPQVTLVRLDGEGQVRAQVTGTELQRVPAAGHELPVETEEQFRFLSCGAEQQQQKCWQELLTHASIVSRGPRSAGMHDDGADDAPLHIPVE